MLKKNKSTIIITSLLCLVPMIIGLLLWRKLPSKVPIHFDVNGNVDGYSTKAMAVFGCPAIMLATHIFCIIVTCLDPKNASGEEQKKNSKILGMVFWLIPIISNVINACIYMIALGRDINVTKISYVLLSIVFILIGNYLPKCKLNYTVGIKVPWALDDEDNWNRTHRMAGKLWLLGGVGLLINVFLGNLIVMFAIIALITFVPIAYSYFIYTRNKNKR